MVEVPGRGVVLRIRMLEATCHESDRRAHAVADGCGVAHLWPWHHELVERFPGDEARDEALHAVRSPQRPFRSQRKLGARMQKKYMYM